MGNLNQRVGSRSNAHVGKAFEKEAQIFLRTQKLHLNLNLKVPVGIGVHKKEHAFDLGCEEQKVIVECKSHRWTIGDNVPSAKLTVWNEAMYYFVAAPDEYRKVFFVLYDFSNKRNESLAEYYIRTYSHLIPNDVELWEYDEATSTAKQLV